MNECGNDFSRSPGFLSKAFIVLLLDPLRVTVYASTSYHKLVRVYFTYNNGAFLPPFL